MADGFAINITTDLRDFDLIVPCGITDKAVTSLENETCQRVPTLEAAANAVARHIGFVFGEQVLAVDSLDDFLASAYARPILTLEEIEKTRAVPEDTPLHAPKELVALNGEQNPFLV